MEVIASTTTGRVQGMAEEGCAVFLGVPYAAAPIGELRFGRPQRHPAWDGARPALHYGATALQPRQEFTLIPEPLIEGDNCLNLNVFTPDPGTSGLPVLVWIHGGGFFAGGNASPWYRGLRFGRDGVVLVSINYRLGVEGFLHVKDGPSNRGVLDWLEALAWVQENAAAFGGDPANVTIAGQSAGGMACATLLSMPAAQGLFRRVISMSGPVDALGDLAGAERMGDEFAARLGVPSSRSALAEVADDRLLDAQAELLPGAAGAPDAEALAARFGARLLRLGPFVDGELIPANPIDAVRAGAGAGIDMLLGTTEQEFNMVAAGVGASLDDQTLVRALAQVGLSADQAAAYRQVAPDLSLSGLLGQVLTDRAFRLPTARLADARYGAPAGTYAYEFRWRSPGLGGRLGSGHCVDIPFVFDVLDGHRVDEVLGADPPRQLARDMHVAWVDFVAHGSPGWPAYVPSRRATMIFDETSEVLDDPLGRQRQIWDGVPSEAPTGAVR
jgi:carboxylesterase type B